MVAYQFADGKMHLKRKLLEVFQVIRCKQRSWVAPELAECVSTENAEVCKLSTTKGFIINHPRDKLKIVNIKYEPRKVIGI